MDTFNSGLTPGEENMADEGNNARLSKAEEQRAVLLKPKLLFQFVFGISSEKSWSCQEWPASRY